MADSTPLGARFNVARAELEKNERAARFLRLRALNEDNPLVEAALTHQARLHDGAANAAWIILVALGELDGFLCAVLASMEIAADEEGRASV